MRRSTSAPLHCKMRIRASSVTSSTSSWSFVSTNHQVVSESSQSDSSGEQFYAALNNRNAFSEARLTNITHTTNNLQDRRQKPNKMTKGGVRIHSAVVMNEEICYVLFSVQMEIVTPFWDRQEVKCTRH